MTEIITKNNHDKYKTIPCAFCEGAGKDPFGVPSKLSNCQVCIGRGAVQVIEPTENCPACAGTGIYKHHRLPCAVCGGKGQLHYISGKDRTYGCKPENKEMLDIETGLPCISAYDLCSIKKRSPPQKGRASSKGREKNKNKKK